MPKITPYLWFDTEAEAAAEFYASVFPNSRVVDVVRFGADGPFPEGTAMVVTVELDGQTFRALNGGPLFTFDEAISFEVDCATQDQIDSYWSKLSEGGTEGPCGWLKDKFGLSWQVVPTVLNDFISDPDPEKVKRVMDAVSRMGKLEIDGLRAAYEGTAPAVWETR